MGMYRTLDDGEIDSSFAMPPEPEVVPFTILAVVLPPRDTQHLSIIHQEPLPWTLKKSARSSK